MILDSKLYLFHNWFCDAMDIDGVRRRAFGQFCQQSGFHPVTCRLRLRECLSQTVALWKDTHVRVREDRILYYEPHSTAYTGISRLVPRTDD